MVINLDPQLTAAINDIARQKGVAPELLAVNALRDRFLTAAARIKPQDGWEERLLGIARDCGVSLSDVALGREELYESWLTCSL